VVKVHFHKKKISPPAEVVNAGEVSALVHFVHQVLSE
jgi:hypothetical protein